MEQCFVYSEKNPVQDGKQSILIIQVTSPYSGGKTASKEDLTAKGRNGDTANKIGSLNDDDDKIEIDYEKYLEDSKKSKKPNKSGKVVFLEEIEESNVSSVITPKNEENLDRTNSMKLEHIQRFNKTDGIISTDTTDSKSVQNDNESEFSDFQQLTHGDQLAQSLVGETEKLTEELEERAESSEIKTANRTDLETPETLSKVPNSKPDSKVPNSKPDSKVPNSKPDSKVANSKPDSKVTNSEPDSKVPNSKPDSKVPNSKQDSKVPNSEPESKVPNSKPDSKVPNSKPDSKVPNFKPETSQHVKSGKEPFGKRPKTNSKTNDLKIPQKSLPETSRNGDIRVFFSERSDTSFQTLGKSTIKETDKGDGTFEADGENNVEKNQIHQTSMSVRGASVEGQNSDILLERGIVEIPSETPVKEIQLNGHTSADKTVVSQKHKNQNDMQMYVAIVKTSSQMNGHTPADKTVVSTKNHKYQNVNQRPVVSASEKSLKKTKKTEKVEEKGKSSKSKVTRSKKSGGRKRQKSNLGDRLTDSYENSRCDTEMSFTLHHSKADELNCDEFTEVNIVNENQPTAVQAWGNTTEGERRRLSFYWAYRCNLLLW